MIDQRPSRHPQPQHGPQRVGALIDGTVGRARHLGVGEQAPRHTFIEMRGLHGERATFQHATQRRLLVAAVQRLAQPRPLARTYIPVLAGRHLLVGLLDLFARGGIHLRAALGQVHCFARRGVDDHRVVAFHIRPLLQLHQARIEQLIAGEATPQIRWIDLLARPRVGGNGQSQHQ
ncbi:hypothetical protein D3C81_1757830 [compost metagenome]